MAILQRTTTSLQKVLRNTQIVRMMSSEPSGGRSEGKFSLIFLNIQRLTIPILSFTGAVREAGGNFSKKQKAEEDQYFRRQQQEQLKKMKEAKLKLQSKEARNNDCYKNVILFLRKYCLCHRQIFVINLR